MAPLAQGSTGEHPQGAQGQILPRNVRSIQEEEEKEAGEGGGWLLMDGEEGRVRLAGRPGRRGRQGGKCAHVCQEERFVFVCR